MRSSSSWQTRSIGAEEVARGFPQELTDTDTIFHYTKLSTALEKILFDGNLRLSSKSDADDHFQWMIYGFPIWQYMADPSHAVKNRELLEKAGSRIIERVKAIRFLCFCKNGVEGKDYDSSKAAKDDYGFLKQRMWSQYSESSTGVCLAFSKSRLVEDAKKGLGSYPFFAEDVEYKPFHFTESDPPETAVLDTLSDASIEPSVTQYLVRCHKSLCFRKHFDFQGENEFRIAVIPGDAAAGDSYIDISSSLKGIITNRFTAEPYREMFCYYKRKFACYLGNVDFDSVSLSPIPCGSETIESLLPRNFIRPPSQPH